MSLGMQKYCSVASFHCLASCVEAYTKSSSFGDQNFALVISEDQVKSLKKGALFLTAVLTTVHELMEQQNCSESVKLSNGTILDLLVKDMAQRGEAGDAEGPCAVCVVLRAHVHEARHFLEVRLAVEHKPLCRCHFI